MKRTTLRRTSRLAPGKPLRTRLTLKTKSDGTHKVWSNYILTRDRRTCQKCGRAAPQWKVDAAHILSKGSAPRLRYHPGNGVSLCFVCHRWYDQHKSTTHDGEAERWVIGKIGESAFQLLLWAKRDGRKVDVVMARLSLHALLAQLEAKATIDRRAVLESLRGKHNGDV